MKQVVFLILVNVFAFAEVGSISGKVLSKNNGLPISGVLLSWNDQTKHCITNEHGVFDCQNLDVGRYKVCLEHENFESRTLFDIYLGSGQNRSVEWEMVERINGLGETKVKSQKNRFKKVDQVNSAYSLSRKEINESPGSSQDINRVIQTLPAAQGSANDLWNGFYVRGGSEDENVFLIDGFELNNLSHWGSEFQSSGTISYLHLDMVRDMVLYAGGVPSALPSRLSSVTELRLRNGSQEEMIYQWDLNMAGTGVFLEGPLGNGSFMLNGRMSFLNLLGGLIPLDGTPKYKNGQGKFQFGLGDLNQIEVLLIASEEEIAFSPQKQAELTSEGNQLGSQIRWISRGDRWVKKTSVSGLNHEYYAGEILDEKVESFSYRSHVKKLELKQNWELFLDRFTLLQVGWSFKKEADEETFSTEEYYKYSDGGNNEYSKTDEGLENLLWKQGAVDSDTLYESYQNGQWVQWSDQFGSWGANVGMRTEYFSLVDEWGLGPRVGLNYSFNSDHELSLNGGVYYQKPGAWALNDSLADLEKISLQRNTQGALGYSWMLSKSLEIKGEAFYKWYDKEPLYSVGRTGLTLVSEGQPLAFKEAYGLEFNLREKSRKGFYYSLAMRTHLVNVERENVTRSKGKLDAPFGSTLVLGYVINREHELSLRTDLSSGQLYTPVDQGASLANHELRYALEKPEDWNRSRREMRKKLHFRYSSNSYFKTWNLRSYFEVKNLLNDQHVVEEYFSDGEVKEALSSGIFPVGGVLIQF